MNNYLVYHLHSDYSSCTTNIDSVTKVKQYVNRAKELGMKALCFSEHGNIYNWVEKKQEIEKAGLKYIHGVEMYITASLEKKVRDNFHCVLIAKNYEGVKEINRLISIANNRNDGHFYYVPRITLEELFKTSKNIIVTSACIGGILSKPEQEIVKKVIKWMDKNSDRCFLEIQHHNVQKQIDHNRELLQIHQDTGLRLIVGTDTHSLNKELADARLILQRYKKTFFSEEEGWDLTFKTYDELIETYKQQDSLDMFYVKEAIENTNVIMDMIEDFEIDIKPKYPKLYEDPIKEFRDIVYKCIDTHPYALKNHSREDLEKRIEEEIPVYEATGTIDFMLFQKYLRDWEHENDIWVGYGRGSVTGSMIAYLLGVTEMDSIKFGLHFFRFLNPSRMSNCDIDSDYGEEDRDRVREFLLTNKKIRTSAIITFGTLALKNAIRAAGGGLGMPLTEIDKICKTCILLNENKEEYVEDKTRKEYPKLFKYVDLLNGVIVNVGTHAGGVLCASRDIESEIGLASSKDHPYPVSVLDMYGLDAGWWTKLDVLGLDNVSIINKTCKMVGIDRVNPDNINLDDWSVWQSMSKDTTAIFQFEGNSSAKALKDVFSEDIMAKIKKEIPGITYLKMMSLTNALIRPCGTSIRDKVCKGNFEKTGVQDIDDLLYQELYNCIIQEDIMLFLMKFCGFNLNMADTARKCIAKGSRILMADGSLKNIEDIQIGDYVQSLHDGITYKPKKVVDFFDNGEKLIYELTCKGGFTLQSTSDHKYLTQDGWKELNEITTNDFIITPKKIHVISDGKRSNQRISTKDMFLIGALIGDGTMKDKTVLAFTNSDSELIEYYKLCVNSRLRSERECQFNITSVKGKTVENIYTIRITDEGYKKSVVDMLEKYKLFNKSKDKHLPKELMSYPPEDKLLSLLGGLFSTDGGVNRNQGFIEYYSISKTLVFDIQTILLKFGIYSTIFPKFVKEYDYYSYSLIISHKESLLLFQNNVLKYMVGKKVNEFNEIINNTPLEKTSFFLPAKFKKEIRDAIIDSGKNILESCRPNEYGITDNIAKKLINDVYCPETYKLLMSDCVFQKVKSVELIGYEKVYDIEVEETHNFVANNITVHNCIAKKKGTEELLPQIKEGFINSSKEKYNLSDKEVDDIINPILKCILDATRYAFSWNHSDAYSAIGYACGYLRYYYPLEFLTVCLNVWKDKEEKTATVFNYASRKGIKIRDPLFRYSRSDYYLDKEANVIYKGMESIKFLNKSAADQLYRLRSRKYNKFIDLLYDLKIVDEESTTKINNRQVEILIKVDFFKEFGNSKELLTLKGFFDEFKSGEALSFSISKFENDPLMAAIIERNCVKKAKTYANLNTKNILYELEEYVKSKNIQDFSIKEKIAFQKDYFGYVGLYTEKQEDRPKLIVLEKRQLISKQGNNAGKPWCVVITTQSIGSNVRGTFTVFWNTYINNPFEVNDVIYCDKWSKNDRGYFQIDKYHQIFYI